MATTLVIPASFALTFVISSGLSQRVMLIVVWTWITVLGLRLRKSISGGISGVRKWQPGSVA